MTLAQIIISVVIVVLAAMAWNASRLGEALDKAVFAERLRPLNEAIATKNKEIADLKILRTQAESTTLALKREVAKLQKAQGEIDEKEVAKRVDAITTTDNGLLAQFERLYGVRAGLAQSCR